VAAKKGIFLEKKPPLGRRKKGEKKDKGAGRHFVWNQRNGYSTMNFILGTVNLRASRALEREEMPAGEANSSKGKYVVGRTNSSQTERGRENLAWENLTNPDNGVRLVYGVRKECSNRNSFQARA